MDINRIIMIIFAVGALIGGVDFLIGNKYGYGEKFEEAIKLMVPTAFNMVGIICLTPTIAMVLRFCIAPIYNFFGIDPGMLGGVLALDMGGYPLAMELASNQEVGEYAGILVGSIFGCALVFAIPFGMGVIKKTTQEDYLMGVIIGLIAMPAGYLAGGLVMGLNIITLIVQSIPVIICSAILIFGLIKIPDKMVAFFQVFAKGLKILINIGLVIASVLYLLDVKTSLMYPITDGMTTVVNITLAMIGSLPFAKLLQDVLKKPLSALGRVLKLQDSACVGFMIGMVSSVPVFTMLDDMDRRSRIVVSAFLIDSAAIMGAHLAYASANSPHMVAALLVCKAVAGIAGIIIGCIYAKQ